jgi:putative Holliday junction resolvase
MICNLSDLPLLCRPRSCLLGLDPGSVVVGVAISDPAWRVASPLVGLERGKFSVLAEKIAAIVRERNVGGVVIGLPKNLDGTEGPSAQAARTFAVNLRTRAGLPDPNLPMVFWDERFSTAAVTRFMLSDNQSRAKRDNKVDQAAAAYILQGALDALDRLTPPCCRS